MVFVQATALIHVRWPFRAGGLTRRQARAAADLRIARGHADVDGSLAWRIRELTSLPSASAWRARFAALSEDLSPTRLPGASPLNRVALRPHASLLVDLADRLDDIDRPIAATGILAVRRILTDPDGPLYARRDDPGNELQEVLDETEMH